MVTKAKAKKATTFHFGKCKKGKVDSYTKNHDFEPDYVLTNPKAFRIQVRKVTPEAMRYTSIFYLTKGNRRLNNLKDWHTAADCPLKGKAKS